MTDPAVGAPQMFDWIFFAIVLLPTIALVWDWLRNK